MRFKSIEERFWAKVDKNGPVPPHCPELGPCWVWTANIDGRGYGQFWVPDERKKHRTHRIAWELTHGPIPTRLFVLHRCDRRKCVRPSHLFIGTALDNSDDMIAKGRQVILRGSRLGRAKLNESQITEIRAKIAQGVRHRIVAAEYGVAKVTIDKISDGSMWRHVSNAVSLGDTTLKSIPP